MHSIVFRHARWPGSAKRAAAADDSETVINPVGAVRGALSAAVLSLLVWLPLALWLFG